MITAVFAAIGILAIGATVRPAPPARCPKPHTESDSTATPARTRPFGPFRRSRPVEPVDAAEVAAWCDALARVVRGGSTLAGAICNVEPPAGCRPVSDQITLALDRGRGLGEALAVQSPSSHLTLALSVMRACATNGGPPAEPLDRAAATLRARANASAERRAQSAQARMSAVVMTVLPVAMLALLLVTSASSRHAATSPAGLIAIVSGGCLNAAGWRWMRRIIGGRES